MEFLRFAFLILLFLTAVFLIVLVLIQRGKGGGLAGALGGMGGQSAFGTKAGDLFTRITIGVAAFWLVLCILAVKFFGGSSDQLAEGMGKAAGQPPAGAAAPATPGQKPAGETAPAAPAKTPSPEAKSQEGAAAPAAPIEKGPAAPAGK